jgi:hypothetical protein
MKKNIFIIVVVLATTNICLSQTNSNSSKLKNLRINGTFGFTWAKAKKDFKVEKGKMYNPILQ